MLPSFNDLQFGINWVCISVNICFQSSNVDGSFLYEINDLVINDTNRYQV